jgi:hypothetical protein
MKNAEILRDTKKEFMPEKPDSPLEFLPMAPEESSSFAEPEGLSLPGVEQPFVSDSIDTPVGVVPRVSSVLTGADHRGTFKARWGVGRMRYAVEPGIYAVGEANRNSRVFVTANYKMSFDALRSSLWNRDAWILVLDTKGVNVWCAAGKRTFGTDELVRRIRVSAVDRLVDHRELILPQLGAPGVAAHLVKKFSGFKVIYGPIRASDLPAFLDAGLKATPEMRRKTFSLGERAVLVPIELVAALRVLAFVLPVFFFLGGLGGHGGFWANVLDHGLFAAAAVLFGVALGAVLTPLFLPFLPGRAFATKGFFLGLIGALLLVYFHGEGNAGWMARLESAAWIFLLPALSAYLAMNFTGSSTYTSLSGVKREMRWAVPVEIAAATVGLVLWVGARFF